MHLEDALRHREIRRAGHYREFEQAAFSQAPIPVGCPQRARSARGQLMRPSCRSASANLHVPPTTLLYKEETLRRARRDTDSLKHLQLGLDETGNLPAQGPNEVSW
jgi:hypothetical protein